MLDFEQWAQANGLDLTTATAQQRAAYQSAWRASQRPAPAPTPTPTPLPVAVVVDDPPNPKSSTFDQTMDAIEAESARQDYIREATATIAESHRGNTDKVKQLRELSKAAITDQKMTAERFDHALMRLNRYDGPMVFAPSQQEVNADVIEAAVCMTGRLSTLETDFSEQTLSAARKNFGNGLGLQDLMGLFAKRGGWRGSSVKAAMNSQGFYRAAFADEGFSPNDYRAGMAGPSTYSLPNILANVANKFLREGFMAVDPAWREFCLIGSTNDFKQKSTVTLTGSLIYKEVARGGELKHGDIGEKQYTNQASTYGLLLGIDRRDLINDDASALTSANKRLGRGAALKLNSLVYTAFLNNSAFFAAGNNNVITGATSVLSGATGLEALRLADEKFTLQTDTDGQPLGIQPRILLVPSALKISAMNLINSTTVVGSTTANSLMPDQNAFSSAFKVVSSPYLQNSSFTGFSATAWYLLADPNEMPVIEVIFLNGQETPTVETADMDWNTLGIALRGYFDGGAALQEFRGGVRAAGA